MTNADKIRSMTDEELAQWLSGLSLKIFYEINPWLKLPVGEHGWLDWLKQGVSDNG